MTTPAVQVQQIGKQYQLGLREKRNQTFREAMVDLAAAPFRRLRYLSGRSHEDDTFWALKDISFDVPEGEVLGIIGHNGAGKSTLLKILSRITEPTEGRATVRGRVSSLLEVGTGFHPELSGRENVYLNGAILGMSRAEIDRKFDEIVDFAGVEKFLDTPIKRYSSGMKVRLAFAVAAHLEPEILIIDEVLAVGDQAFQNKCLGKMNDVATSGRTVLFVSHNMAAVEGLCSLGMLLQHGQVVKLGRIEDVIQQYMLKSDSTRSDYELSTHDGRVNGYPAVVQRLRIQTNEDDFPGPICVGSNVRLQLMLDLPNAVRCLRVAIRILNSMGQRVTTCHNDYQHGETFTAVGPVCVTCTMKNCRLSPGLYSIELQIDDGRTVIDHIKDGVTFRVESSDVYGTGREMPSHAAIFLPEVEWEMTSKSV